MIYSDPGTQLVGASRELKEWRQGWKQEELIAFGSERQLEWVFIVKLTAPEWNHRFHRKNDKRCKEGNVPGYGGHKMNTK